jgi:hypothetical protein
VKTVSIPRAPKEIREEYLARSIPFKKWLEDRLISQEENRRDAIGVVKGKQTISSTLPAIAEKIKANPLPYLKRRLLNKQEKLVWDTNAIMNLEGISDRNNAYRILHLIGNPPKSE